MSRFNLSDRQSSTVLLSSDSLGDILDAVQSVLRNDGPDGLDGMSISVQVVGSDELVDFDDDEIMRALQNIQAEELAASHSARTT